MITYRNFNIEKGDYGWNYTHVNYDGPEDTRIGTAKTFANAMSEVDEMIYLLESGELKVYRPMEAWSGGIADNH